MPSFPAPPEPNPLRSLLDRETADLAPAGRWWPWAFTASRIRIGPARRTPRRCGGSCVASRDSTSWSGP